MSEFKEYKRKSVSEMRPFIKGEVLEEVSVSDEDKLNGSPKVGDMIARNPKNHLDQWLVAEKYFKDNLEPNKGFVGKLIDFVLKNSDEIGESVELSYRFLEMETKQLDKGESNVEEEN